MPMFSIALRFFSGNKAKISKITQAIWANQKIQAAWFAVATPVGSLVSLITSNASLVALWKNDGVQATFQGLAAPFYSYRLLKDTMRQSDDLRIAIHRSFDYTDATITRAFMAYFFYYRMLEPLVASYGDDGEQFEGGKNAIFAVMHIVLFFHLLRSVIQNIAYTSLITGIASKNSTSEHFASSQSSASQMLRADTESLGIYVGGRYLVNLLSQLISVKLEGLGGRLLSYALESAFFGWSLLDYKFSALGRSTDQRLREIFGCYKLYFFMYGVSFVAITRGVSFSLSKIDGDENGYIYDAMFAFMFQLYAAFAILREEPFPGNDSITIDIVAITKWLSQAPFAPYLLEKLLGELYSLEEFVKSPGVSLWLSVRSDELKDTIDAIKSGLNQVERLNANIFLSTMQRVGQYAPFSVIPANLKNVYGMVDKKLIAEFIIAVEKLLETARNAEERRNDYRRVEAATTFHNYSHPREKKSAVVDATVRIFSNEESSLQLSRAINDSLPNEQMGSAEEEKHAEGDIDHAAPGLGQELVVDNSDYFSLRPDSPARNVVASSLGHFSQNNPTTSQQLKKRKQQQLAARTAGVIAEAGIKQKASR